MINVRVHKNGIFMEVKLIYMHLILIFKKLPLPRLKQLKSQKKFRKFKIKLKMSKKKVKKTPTKK